MSYDFCGWATRNNIKCSDGRTIRKDAFKHDDGIEVPLVWNHQHGGVGNVLGHAKLQNREEGVYAFGTFNATKEGQNAKELVMHKDVTRLSIFANQIKQQGGDVIHGAIKEVSLVLAGANPGAVIETVIEHDEFEDESAIMRFDDVIEIAHSEEKEDPKKMGDKNTDKKEENAKTVGEVMATLNEEQKAAVYTLLGKIMKDNGIEPEDDNEGGEKEMKHNLFDNDEVQQDGVLSHAEEMEIINDAKRYGSMKESFLAHAADYGIDGIETLFPEYQSVNGETPSFVKRQPEGWVNTVMSGVHHTPFSRIKMMFADLREDEARAKGYMKGNLKKDEVFGLLKRVVEPTTVYKKQKLDRDDVIDITDFDVVAWLKGEMRMMLDEELARAFIFGDGRTNLSADKIKETNIIPIVHDDDFYAIKKTVIPEAGESLAHAIVTAAVKGLIDYEGSGNTTLFVDPETITTILLEEDGFGHRLYKDVNEAALAMGVNRIVKVPSAVMPSDIHGVIVDLSDYNVGADKGGAVNMFDDFDIDYNQMAYLIETRCSGALTKPYSALVLKKNA